MKTEARVRAGVYEDGDEDKGESESEEMTTGGLKTMKARTRAMLIGLSGERRRERDNLDEGETSARAFRDQGGTEPGLI